MKISHISFARNAAIFGGIPLGVAMVVVQIVVSQSPEWDRFMLLMAGSTGALLACIYHRSKPLLASIRHDTVIGSTVGLSGALVYFTITAIIFAVLVSRSAVFGTSKLRLLVLGVVQLTVAAGLGGMVVGLIAKLRPHLPEAHKEHQ